MGSYINTDDFVCFLQVSEIEARSALLEWGPPVRDQGEPGAANKFESLEHITDADFRYEVNKFDFMLGDVIKFDQKYNSKRALANKS